MRKTRILASLLCLMMVVCALPMLQVSADAVYADSIADIMGVDSVTNWQYSWKLTSTLAGATASGVQNVEGGGVEFPAATKATYAMSFSSDPWKTVNATVIRAKFGSADASTESVFITGATAGGYSRHYTTLYPTKITSPNGSTVGNFNFGTDWFDLLVYSKTASDTEGFEIWAKNDSTNGQWVQLIQSRYRKDTSGDNTVGSGISFQRNATNYAGNFIIQSVDVYQEGKSYSSVDEIMGGAVTSTYAFDFNNDFDATITGGTAGEMTAVTGTDANGIDLNSAGFKFSPTKNKWSPLNGNLIDGAYLPQALYFEMKLNDGASVLLQTTGPSGNGRIYRTMAEGAALTANGANATITPGITLDTNWFENLIVPNNTVENGYTHYIKSATLTNNQWVAALTSTNYRDYANSYVGTGLQFGAGNGYLKSFRTYQLAVTDNESKPADATLLYYSDDMAAAPTYGNLSTRNITYTTDGEADVATFPSTSNSDWGQYYLNYAEIPVGGYAELRTKTNGTIIFNLIGGENKIAYNSYTVYAGVDGQSGVSYMLGQDNTIWRNWRIVRNASGYTFYTKTDGDTGWKKVFENFATVTDSVTYQFNLIFRQHMSGNGVGTGALDYLKIYGPASNEKLILTDGVGTKVLEEGGQIGYGANLRPIVQAQSGKLLVVSYQGDNMVRAQLVDVNDLTAQQSFPVSGGNADKVKVFLWDNLTNLNRLTPAITLNI